MGDFGGGFWEWISQYGGWGVAIIAGAFIVWMVSSGRWVPKSWVDKVYDSNEKLSEALEKYSDAWPQIQEHMRTTNHVLTEIQRAPEHQRDGGST